MKQILLLSIFLLTCLIASAQATLSGKVTDDKGKPVTGASVYLDNTLDGGTSDSAGNFKFTTTETGQQLLRWLSMQPVDDVTIQNVSLEDIFMKEYDSAVEVKNV